MAIKLTATYAKRLGLPGYSSHQFSVTVEAELTDLGNVQGETSRLYGLLQDAVDREIQHVGFVPDQVYGLEPGSNGDSPVGESPGNGSPPPPAPSRHGTWNCSDKQRQFILRLLAEHELDRAVIEELATERFGHSLAELNKLEASGLIDELLETYAPNRNGNTNGSNGNGHGTGSRRLNGNGNGRYARNGGGAARSRGGRS